jgi:methionyl-tRNA formyltransferase
MDTLHVSSVTHPSSDALVTDRGRECSEIACSQRSLTRGESESGASVYLVDTEYDTGESLSPRTSVRA